MTIIPRISSSRSVVWLTAIVAAALLGAACGGGDKVTGTTTTPPPTTPAGSYTLNTIDAKSLPYTMYADTGYTLEVSGGSLSITADGKWVSKVTTRETVVGNVSTYSDSSFGTWTLSTGSTVAVLRNAETGTNSNATWTATNVTVLDNDGTTTRTVIYKKN